eukprot:4113391-Amphidinium_carterae.1
MDSVTWKLCHSRLGAASHDSQRVLASERCSWCNRACVVFVKLPHWGEESGNVVFVHHSRTNPCGHSESVHASSSVEPKDTISDSAGK